MNLLKILSLFADLSFEQDANNIAGLLKNLHLGKADFFGFSSGATTVLQPALRYPDLADKIILGSPLAKRNGVWDWFWGFMREAQLEHMPAELQEAYQKVALDPKALQIMHERDVKRMIHFRDIPDEQIESVRAPALIIVGDKDVITPEHALALHWQMTHSELAIIPGGHGEYIERLLP